MSSEPLSSLAFRVADLPHNRSKKFDLRPKAEQNEVIASELGLIGLRKLRFFGEITANGKSDWRMSGTIGATVVQACTITLEPVTTRLDLPVERFFVKHMDKVEEDDVEMPEDENIEQLGEWIDPEATMIEALSLALPEYPRAEGAQLGETIFTEPGNEPMSDEAARPFAGLALLKDQLKSGDE